jgi:serine/threonine-protein kinase
LKIRLPNGEWEVHDDQPLGRKGGFGAVFAGTRRGFPPLAIKRLNIAATDSAYREPRIADALSRKDLRHVIPIYDFGRDAESEFYFIVMPRAARSLREALDRKESYSAAEAAAVLLQVTEGLTEVDGIVHRDLKPENILLHDGQWKIADFGIATYMAESTSLTTWKDFLSPPYAAPEEWRGEPVSPATDLYAMGCTAYELVQGRTPFVGASQKDYERQHLHSQAPALACDSAPMRALVSMLLRKDPETRPSREQASELLAGIANTSRARGPRRN